MRIVWILCNALLTSVVMIVSRDGHGVGLIVGASVAAVLLFTRMVFRSKGTKNFAESPIGERQVAH